MNDFLEKVRENKKCLREWMRESVIQLDDTVVRCFPIMFGKEWLVKMRNFPTESRTKLLTYIFNHALDETAERLGINYAPAKSGDDCFACHLFNYQVRKKLSMGKSTDSFASGAKNNKNNPNIVLAVNISADNRTWESEAVFAGVIDLTVAQHPETKWYTGGTNHAPLKIHKQDIGVIVPVYGQISPKDKFIHLERYSLSVKKRQYAQNHPTG